MSLIRMKTEHVEDVIQKMDWVVLQMSVKPSKLHSLAGSLQTAWEGGGASRYANEIRQLATRLQHVNSDLQRLGTRTRAEIAEWVNADATHDFAVAKPTYMVAPGGGPLKPKTPNVDYKSILDWIGKSNWVSTIGLKLEGVDNPIPWLGAILATIKIFPDLVNWVDRDFQKYTTDEERLAALYVDLKFAETIIGLKVGLGAASSTSAAIALAGLFTGVGTIPSAAGLVLSVGAYFLGNMALDQIAIWFPTSSIHDAIVQSVAQGISSTPGGPVLLMGSMMGMPGLP
jgi:uncharacterized protein YukE